jgi:hypothetical protein
VTRQPSVPLISETGRAQELADWQARFTPLETGPYCPVRDLADGRRREDVVYPGEVWWHCPGCGELVQTAFMMRLNHGWDPERPGWEPWSGCTSLELRKAHALYDSRRAMVRHLIADGLDDEQVAAEVDCWSAATIAGYRKDDAKKARLAARAARGERVTVGHGSECPCAFCEGPCGCPSCAAYRGNPSSAATPACTTGGRPIVWVPPAHASNRVAEQQELTLF